MKVKVVAVVVGVSLIGAAIPLTGCGGSDGPPKSVSRADLDKTKGFWNELPLGLKDDLTKICKDRGISSVQPGSAGEVISLAAISKTTVDAYRGKIDYYLDHPASDELEKLTIGRACYYATGEIVTRAFQDEGLIDPDADPRPTSHPDELKALEKDNGWDPDNPGLSDPEVDPEVP